MNETLDQELAKEIAKKSLDGLEIIQKNADIDLKKPFYKHSPEQYKLEYLKNNPAIARVVAESQWNGNIIELFVCNYAPPVGDTSRRFDFSPVRMHDRSGVQFASYHSAMGQLVSRNVGDCIQDFEILEVEKFDCFINPQELVDSKDTQVQLDNGIFTVCSLRELLDECNKNQISVFDLLSQTIVSPHKTKPLIVKGAVRGVKKSFGLEVAIGDAKQDDIFRQPIDQSLIVLGAPGTGKTSTLVNRLIQLQERVKNVLGVRLQQSLHDQSNPGDLDHECKRFQKALRIGMNQQWMLFVPSGTLREYVRNALDNKAIGNLDKSIYLWEDYQHTLGRKSFKFLKSPNHLSGATLNNKDGCWRNHHPKELISLFEDFQRHRESSLLKELRNRVETLQSSKRPELANIGKKLCRSLDRCEGDVIASISAVVGTTKSFVAPETDYDTLLTSLIKHWSSQNATLVERTNKVKTWLDSKCISDEADKPEDDDEPNEQETESTETLLDILKHFLKDYARAQVSKRIIKKGSRLGTLIEILEPNFGEDPRLLEIGNYLIEDKMLRKLRPEALYREWMEKILKQYKTFRKQEIEKENTQPRFIKSLFRDNYITSDELDILILTQLRAMDRLWGMRYFDDKLQEFAAEHCRMMVFVDEMTDFTPIQLAAMYHLAHPTLRSFFACGDLNQNMTIGGTQTMDQIHWSLPIPSRDIFSLNLVYRQTAKLHRFCQHFLDSHPIAQKDASTPNEHVRDLGVEPALAEHMETVQESAEWIAKRIVEIYSQFDENDYPTIAIFVPAENDVAAFADALRETDEISDYSLRVAENPTGRSEANDSKISIYPANKIKGMEFQAAFFDRVDMARKLYGESFPKILYVGASRAIMYFGMTCEKELPCSMEGLRSQFVTSWGK